MGVERVGAARHGWGRPDTFVVGYALNLVLWIFSLSLADVNGLATQADSVDGDLDNYRGIFRGDLFSSAPINFHRNRPRSPP